MLLYRYMRNKVLRIMASLVVLFLGGYISLWGMSYIDSIPYLGYSLYLFGLSIMALSHWVVKDKI